jgi:hypothetical protein
MRTRRWWGWTVGPVLAGLLSLGACAAERKNAPHPADDDLAEISADHLDDLDEEGAMADLFDPEERAAMERSGLSSVGEKRSAEETAGGVGLSVLTVALSVGAVVAPFFLF